mmetsp:Transcript_6118/g.16627  ORF Transcript_6118/g.16627 Transcript_6118/m.16627 type:complete len:275 (+) Transcript_6118:1157-1981(+)
MSRACGPAVLGRHQLFPGARSQPCAARLAALGPVAPLAPAAVHRAGHAVAQLRLPRGSLAGPTSEAALDQGLALARSRAIAAGRRASSPAAPIRPHAIHWATLGVAWLSHLRLALARAAAEGRRHRGLAPALEDPATTGAAAARPGAPIAPLAVHRTALGAARALLHGPTWAVLAAVGGLQCPEARARGAAPAAGPRAIRPRTPLGPLTVHRAAHDPTTHLLLGRAFALLAPTGSLHCDRAVPRHLPSTAAFRASRPVTPGAPLAINSARLLDT